MSFVRVEGGFIQDLTFIFHFLFFMFRRNLSMLYCRGCKSATFQTYGKTEQAAISRIRINNHTGLLVLCHPTIGWVTVA